MNNIRNPFDYEAANNLPPEKIATYFIDDYNYSRFINSTRNVVLVGDRGCGKTMALMFNSLKVQMQLQPEVANLPERVGIYVPCKAVLMRKNEQELLQDSKYASILSEHFLTMSVLYHLVDHLSEIPEVTAGKDENLKEEISYSLGFELSETDNALKALRQTVNKEVLDVQVALNHLSPETTLPPTRSFGTSVLPLLDTLRELPRLKDVHFMVMLDDVHDLNDAQVRAVNSWIAYRDHSLFSVKVASARVRQPHFKTSTGGTILDGHDFVQIDLEQSYHNEESNFGKLAQRLISRRLKEIGINSSPNEFFPVNANFEKELEKCRLRVRERAKTLYPDGPEKTINDYVYRFARAEWFRQRPPHANLPAYSGFQTLVYLSTGVIRNLLEPCYWMFDDAMSATSGDGPVVKIDANLQRDRIIDRSKKAWDLLQNLDRFVEGCSRDDVKRLYSLFNQLAILFRKRLEEHDSEPRAISFTISSMSPSDEQELLPLLDIARAAQLLYSRSGPAKERGRRETYYVPNRMLWPVRGLDPHGQHARVSIRAKYLLAALDGEAIPFTSKEDEGESQAAQEGLFYEET